ncbi:thiamine phosphate synthase [Pedobacter faecalis]|uniref:thiamine phosphate synthase n=1 Tax=Pedobacter faecalis TaxID=3041495 RepID=UPI0025509B5D|nr:thiamine phosphate synthase [Pedobacter sp. ELA7]
MELIVISSPAELEAEAPLINRLFEAGMQLFHLRKPGLPLARYRDLLAGIDAAFHDRVALHQHHELGDEFGILRLHLPELQRRELDANGYPSLYKDKYLSTSVHSRKDLGAMSRFEYVFYGPLFDSLSKPGYRGIGSSNIVIQAAEAPGVEAVQPRLIALGGISATKLGDVQMMGFDGIAVLGAIWNVPARSLDNFNHLKWETDLMR